MADETEEVGKDAKSDEDLHQTLAKLYSDDLHAEDDNREEALDDLRFRALDQWEEEIKRQYELPEINRPCLVVDHISQHVRQITGDIRLNKPAIKVSPVDNGADVAGAELRTGLIRHIEASSDATTAYVNGADGAASCGIGHWRLETEYESEAAFDQVIKISPIWNHLSVVWDRHARHPTRKDAKHCFVIEAWSKESFEARWPNETTSSFDDEHGGTWRADWLVDNDDIIVAEYWCKKRKGTKELWLLADGRTISPDDYGEADLDLEIAQHNAALAALGRPPAKPKSKTVPNIVVERRLMSGVGFLPDEDGDLVKEWHTDDIPIIACIGEEIHVGNRIERRGIIRACKDPQRMINVQASSAVETVMNSPKAPYVVTDKEVQGREDEWAQANKGNRAYLTFTPDSRIGPGRPTREAAPTFDAASIQLVQSFIGYMQAATGLYAAGALGQEGPETSGVAIMNRERQGDVGTFQYMDNVSMSIGETARQLLKLIPKVMDGDRIIRILGEDDAVEMMRVNVLTPNGVVNDLTSGHYDFRVSSGKSFSTRRQEAAQFMLEFIRTSPEHAMRIMDLLFKSLDAPYAEEIEKRFRQILIQQGVVEADLEKGEQPRQPQGPTPEDMLGMAEVEKARANTAETMADIEKKRAETEQTQLENIEQILKLTLESGQMQEMVRQEAQAAIQEIVAAGMLRQNGPLSPAQ